MLPTRHRMRGSEEFATAIRAGARIGSRRVVVHYGSQPGTHSRQPARVGFVVSKAVGNAVVRNLVRRRLRSAMASEVAALGDGQAVVIRALPPASTASYAELREDVRSGLRRAQAKSKAGADRNLVHRGAPR